jgi:hypothetical protein
MILRGFCLFSVFWCILPPGSRRNDVLVEIVSLGDVGGLVANLSYINSMTEAQPDEPGSAYVGFKSLQKKTACNYIKASQNRNVIKYVRSVSLESTLRQYKYDTTLGWITYYILARGIIDHLPNLRCRGYSGIRESVAPYIDEQLKTARLLLLYKPLSLLQ